MQDRASTSRIERYVPMAIGVTRRVRADLGCPCPHRELVGYAIAGLIEAERAFDPDRGVRFASFAYHRIRGAVIDGMRTMAPLPRRAHRRIQAASEALRDGAPDGRSIGAASTEHGRLSMRSVASALGYEPETFATPARCEIDPLDEDPPDAFARAGELGADDALDRARALARIPDAIGALTREEQIVVRGIHLEERTLEDVGDELGISRSWACRIHARALARLKERLGDG